MSVIEGKINEFLDAIAQVHGEEYRNNTEVKHRGGTQIMLKHPGKEGALIGLDTLELMTKNLLKKAQDGS